MKLGYTILIIILVILFVAFVAWVLISPLGEETRLGNAIQGAAVFAALLAAVIALAAVDPKRRTVKVRIEPSIESKNHVLTHSRIPSVVTEVTRQMVPELPNEPKSYQVHFMVTNISGFTWEKPTLTFRLPIDKRHPDKDHQTLTFRSNLFNYQAEVRTLTFADTFVLSNSNLPYSLVSAKNT